MTNGWKGEDFEHQRPQLVHFLWKTGTKPNEFGLQPEGIRKAKGEDKEKVPEAIFGIMGFQVPHSKVFI